MSTVVPTAGDCPCVRLGRSLSSPPCQGVRVVTGATITEGKIMTRATTWEKEPSGEEGAATAEYAIATMAAVGFAGLLVVIMRSEEVRQILLELVRSALTFAG